MRKCKTPAGLVVKHILMEALKNAFTLPTDFPMAGAGL